MVNFGKQSILAGVVSFIVLFLALQGTIEMVFINFAVLLIAIILGIIAVAKEQKVSGIIGICIGSANLLISISLILLNN